MTENVRQILQMLAIGQISIDEAERLISALDGTRPPNMSKSPNSESTTKTKPKYLRVVVESPDHFGGQGPGRVNIRVPMQFLRAGMRLTSFIPPQALDQANQALRDQGIKVDLRDIKPQHLEELIEQLDELTVDIDEPGIKVRLYCE